MKSKLSTYVGKFVVVETTDDTFLGTLELLGTDHALVRTGFVGRPPVVLVDDIVDITLASRHPGVAA